MKYYNYYPNFITENFLEELVNEIELKQDYIDFDGVLVRESRLTSWQTSTNDTYSYAGKPLKPKPFTQTVNYLKNIIQNKYQVKLDSVLINYYQDGNDHINYHSDNYQIHKNNDIFVLSFGDTRKFIIREKKIHSNRDIFDISNGDLFHMYGKCQELYDHSIRRDKNNQSKPRISLSFRCLSEE